jgi:hypothetical protein
MVPLGRILRPSSLTDQLFIQGQAHPVARDSRGSRSWAKASGRNLSLLINYGIVGLIQLEHGFSDTVDMTPDEAMAIYETHAKAAYELMRKKNHDYGEAWRSMRVSSYTDFILTKIERIKELEDIGGAALVSEGIDANLYGYHQLCRVRPPFRTAR